MGYITMNYFKYENNDKLLPEKTILEQSIRLLFKKNVLFDNFFKILIWLYHFKRFQKTLGKDVLHVQLFSIDSKVG